MIDQLLVHLTLPRPGHFLFACQVAVWPHRLRIHAHLQATIETAKTTRIPLEFVHDAIVAKSAHISIFARKRPPEKALKAKIR